MPVQMFARQWETTSRPVSKAFHLQVPQSRSHQTCFPDIQTKKRQNTISSEQAANRRNLPGASRELQIFPIQTLRRGLPNHDHPRWISRGRPLRPWSRNQSCVVAIHRIPFCTDLWGRRVPRRVVTGERLVSFAGPSQEHFAVLLCQHLVELHHSRIEGYANVMDSIRLGASSFAVSSGESTIHLSLLTPPLSRNLEHWYLDFLVATASWMRSAIRSP